MARVTFENVTKLYGRKKAINNISFSCKEGEFFSIVGPTGAGKSTILKMIAGIETVTSGRLLFNDRVMNKVPPQERNVSMAFETYNLYPHMKVYENIAFPLRAPRWGYKLNATEERKKVEEIATFLGIDELLERLPQHLSGGQKQRVSLARSLVRKPEVYLLDEPIAHLDARLKFSTQTLLKEFATEYKSTIIYVTHDYREALALSDRMIVLKKGTIEQEGTPNEIYNRPISAFVGITIGEPPMNIIRGEVKKEAGSLLFKSGDDFSITLDNALAEAAQKAVAGNANGSCVLLGIRCEHIGLARKKISDNSFQMPIYAITHEAGCSIVCFELKDGTLIYVRVGGAPVDFKESEKIWLDFDSKNVFFYPDAKTETSKQGSSEK